MNTRIFTFHSLLNVLLLLLLQAPSYLYYTNSFQIPLPGGKSISFNSETGVLRIKTKSNTSTNTFKNIQVPPLGTNPSNEIINSIIVKDTGIPQKGFGAFASQCIKEHKFIGFYVGDVIRTRETLDEIVKERSSSVGDSDSSSDSSSTGAMDYVMSIDGGVTFIDGYERAKDRTTFATVHLNHADKDTDECNCIRILEDDGRVAFFTSRDIQIDEELCFNYGSNFWIGREDSKV